jgi:hypothetical protein
VTLASTHLPSYVPVGVAYVTEACPLNAAVPVKVRYRAAGSDTTENETIVNDAVKIDLTEKFSENIVPGSINFNLGGRNYFDRQGSLYYGLEVATGAATLAGTINYATGDVVIEAWAPGGSADVALLSLLTTLDGRPVTTVTFRIPIAPIRPSSFQVLATKLAGGTINATSDNDGDIADTGVTGHIDYETGVVVLQFGTLVVAAGNESEEWYDADLVDVDGNIWRPEPVFAETVKFNAVAFTYLPLDADILGLDPVRLPQDGRVPIFRIGGFVVVGHTDETAPTTVADDDTIDVGRVRLSRVRVKDASGATINTGYTVDLDAGIVTFVDVTGYDQPVTVEHRIEDMLQVSDVQISGDMSFTRAITHDYPVPGSMVSSALITGDLKARVQFVFDQATWDGVSWGESVSGSPATGTYNTLAGPIEVTNDGAVTENWAFRFTSTTAGQIIGEHVGVIGEFSINTETAPTNPATGQPYFTIPTTGWGIGWAVGNIVRMKTIGALVPIWLVRTVQQGPETSDDHSFTLLARGDVDAP